MGGSETATLWFMERHPRFENEKPYLFTYPLDNQIPSNMKHEPRDGIVIQNLREYVPSYDESGIGFLNLPTALQYEDYDNTDKVEEVLLPRIREALRVFLGANTVHIIEYRMRKRDPDFPLFMGKPYEYLQPAIGAHVDYTPGEILKILEVARQGDAGNWMKHRIQALNLWSPLKGPLRDWPLCVCDSSTVGLDDDLQVADVVFRDKVAENFQVHYSNRHKWYYVKDQMPEEFLVFRAMDTARPQFAAVPHCSFQCAQASESEIRRESIEIRVLVLHDEPIPISP